MAQVEQNDIEGAKYILTNALNAKRRKRELRQSNIKRLGSRTFTYLCMICPDRIQAEEVATFIKDKYPYLFRIELIDGVSIFGNHSFRWNSLSRFSSIRMVKVVTELHRDYFDMYDERGDTILIHICRFKHQFTNEMLEYYDQLLTESSELRSTINWCNHSRIRNVKATPPYNVDYGPSIHWTPLTTAALFNHPGMVRLLLKHGARLPIRIPASFDAKPHNRAVCIISNMRRMYKLKEWRPQLDEEYLPPYRECMSTLLLLAKSKHV